MFEVYIAPHERYEAIEAYRDKLTPSQIAEIKDAPDEAPIMLRFDGISHARIIIEEIGT